MDTTPSPAAAQLGAAVEAFREVATQMVQLALQVLPVGQLVRYQLANQPEQEGHVVSTVSHQFQIVVVNRETRKRTIVPLALIIDIPPTPAP